MKKLLIYILILIQTNISQAQSYYLKKCYLDQNNKEVCSLIDPDDTYHRTKLSDLKPEQCYQQDLGNKLVFLKVKKVMGDVITAISQSSLKERPKEFKNTIIVGYFNWNGDYFNENSKEVPCKQTPSLSDTNFLKVSCGIVDETLRGNYICEKERKPSSFIEEPSFEYIRD